MNPIDFFEKCEEVCNNTQKCSQCSLFETSACFKKLSEAVEIVEKIVAKQNCIEILDDLRHLIDYETEYKPLVDYIKNN